MFSSPITKSKKSVISWRPTPRQLPPSKPNLESAVSLYTLVKMKMVMVMLYTLVKTKMVMVMLYTLVKMKMVMVMLYTLVKMKGTRWWPTISFQAPLL